MARAEKIAELTLRALNGEDVHESEFPQPRWCTWMLHVDYKVQQFGTTYVGYTTTSYVVGEHRGKFRVFVANYHPNTARRGTGDGWVTYYDRYFTKRSTARKYAVKQYMYLHAKHVKLVEREQRKQWQKRRR